MNLRLHEQAAALLEEAQKHSVGTELAKIIPLDPDLPLPETIVGEEGGFTVKIPKCSDMSMTLHNHASGETFSGADIDNFVVDAKARYMCVIGNNGIWYILEKTDQFNWIEFQKRAFDISKENDYAIKILEEAVNYGFKYHKIGD